MIMIYNTHSLIQKVSATTHKAILNIQKKCLFLEKKIKIKI